MKLFYLVSDPLPMSRSVNKRVAARFVEFLQAEIADLTIIEIDVNRDPPPYYDIDLYRYVWEPVANPAYEASASETIAAQYMCDQARQLRSADLLLVSAPVWNYYLPAVLKAWIDQVMSPGQMFRLGPRGREPMHRIGAFIGILSAGGMMSSQGFGDSLLQLLRAPFQYAGIDRCHDLLVEGQEPALFEDHAERETRAVDMARQIASTIAEEHLRETR